MTREEVRRLLAEMTGPTRLMAELLYGSGLRLLKCARLRVKDIDLGARHLVVRAGKGDRDRVALLPERLRRAPEEQLCAVRVQHARDLERGAGWVELPLAFERKAPRAGRELAWSWVFPATRTYWHAPTRQRRRHHLHETVLQRAVREAVRRAGIPRGGRVPLRGTRVVLPPGRTEYEVRLDDLASEPVARG